MLAELCNNCGNEMYTWHECEDGVCEECLAEEEERLLNND